MTTPLFFHSITCHICGHKWNSSKYRKTGKLPSNCPACNYDFNNKRLNNKVYHEQPDYANADYCATCERNYAPKGEFVTCPDCKYRLRTKTRNPESRRKALLTKARI